MPRKTFSGNGPNAEEAALEKFADLVINKIENLKADAKWEQP